jgi:hypothetical protein
VESAEAAATITVMPRFKQAIRYAAASRPINAASKYWFARLRGR